MSTASSQRLDSFLFQLFHWIFAGVHGIMHGFVFFSIFCGTKSNINCSMAAAAALPHVTMTCDALNALYFMHHTNC